LIRKNALEKTRILAEGASFILLLCSMVWLVLVYQNLPDRYPLAFDSYGRISEWGTPLHFVFVFCAGMAIYGGLTVMIRSKSLWGISLLIHEPKGKKKYDITLLMFSLLKALSVGMFLAVMYNMYARVRHSRLIHPADWIIFVLAGAILLTVAVYLLAIFILNRKRKLSEE
jgi:uncharacterized membrane protein